MHEERKHNEPCRPGCRPCAVARELVEAGIVKGKNLAADWTHGRLDEAGDL